MLGSNRFAACALRRLAKAAQEHCNDAVVAAINTPFIRKPFIRARGLTSGIPHSRSCCVLCIFGPPGIQLCRLSDGLMAPPPPPSRGGSVGIGTLRLGRRA